MKTSSASEGMVWITPARVRMVWPSRGRRQARIPSGTARAMAAASETATRKRCSSVRRQIRCGAPSDFASDATPNLVRRKSESVCASETWSSRARAFMAIVVENDQVGGLDLRVGGVQVGGGDVARAQRAVGQLVVHAAHARVGESVDLPQARPAVAPAQELVGEADLQLRVPREL